MDKHLPPFNAATDRLSQFARTLPRLGSLASYLSAILVISIAALVKLPLDALAGQPLPPYITFYPAVVIAGLLGGPRVGIGAGLVTLAIAWLFFLPPTLNFTVISPATSLTVGIYALTSTSIGAIVGLSRVAFDRVAAGEAERDVAARESVHRIKNLISVVQAMAAKVATETSTVDRFQALLRSRLAAIGHAQEVLVRRDWQDVELEEVIKSALEPFLYNPGLKVKYGPAVIVPARNVSGLSMALFELCTNAMKYGALAGGKGPVTLSWSMDGDRAVLSWVEILASPIAQETTGFGSALVRNALSGAPGASVRYEITTLRVEAEFRWRAQDIG
jgi:two-component sensor histidine kinase